MSRETETECYGAGDCRLDRRCHDYSGCAEVVARENRIRADERRKTAEEIAEKLDEFGIMVCLDCGCYSNAADMAREIGNPEQEEEEDDDGDRA